MKNEHKIILKYEYDNDYRHLLWKAVRADYDRSNYGQKPFFDREMEPRIRARLGDIEIENSDERFQIPDVYDDRKLIGDYLRNGGIDKDETEKSSSKKRKPRNFSALVIRMFDAYMKIKHPVIATTFAANRDTDATGFVFGEFLTDVEVRRRLYDLEVTRQSLIGIYEYQEETTASVSTGGMRYLAVFYGDTQEYLLVMDFCWSPTEKIIHLVDEHLRLYYGFCIPGRKFSPVILRSLDQRERQVGMMYGKDALVDFSAPTLEQIYFQTYTTDSDHFPHEPALDETEDNKLFQEVLRLKEGPVFNRTMYKIKDDSKYNAIAKRIERIKRDRL